MKGGRHVHNPGLDKFRPLMLNVLKEGVGMVVWLHKINNINLDFGNHVLLKETKKTPETGMMIIQHDHFVYLFQVDK